jgi:hypothetical protein
MDKSHKYGGTFLQHQKAQKCLPLSFLGKRRLLVLFIRW